MTQRPVGVGASTVRVPATGSAFVGRGDELEVLAAILDEPTVRLVTVTGLAGVGKTRLADEHVARAAGPRRIVSVELAALDDVAMADDAIVRSLPRPEGVPAGISLGAASTVRELFGDDPFLVILNNTEQIDGLGDYVLALLAESPGLQVLATGITPLHVVGERVLRLAPFPASDDWRHDPAVELFAERARAADAGFVLDADNAADVAAVCRILAGYPLAIELAAARVAAYPPATMCRLLATKHADDVLRRTEVSGIAERHRSVRAALDWTVGLLPDDAATVLQQISVFRDPFTPHAAAAVLQPAMELPELLDRLSDLVDVQLLDPHPPSSGDPRFGLRHIVRSYARRRLRSAGQEDRARAAHAEYWRGLCRHDPGSASSSWTDLTAALDYSVREGRSDEALGAAVAAATAVSRASGAEASLVTRVASIVESDPSLEEGLAARSLLWSALRTPMRGDELMDYGQQTAERLRRAVHLARSSGDDASLLEALEVTVLSLDVTMDLPAAVSAVPEGLMLATRLDDQRALARFEIYAALSADHAQDRAQMLELALSGYQRGAAAGDDLAIIYGTTLMLRLPPESRPDLDPPLPRLEDLLVLAEQHGHNLPAMHVLTALTQRDLASGDTTAAIGWLERHLLLTLTCQRTIPLGPLAPIVLATVALVRLDEIEDAIRLRESIAPLERVVQGAFPGQAAEFAAAVQGLRERVPEQTYAALESEVAGSSLQQAGRLALRLCRKHRNAQRTAAPVGPAGNPASDALVQPLTPRERQVLVELARGGTNRDLAAALGLTPKTVMHHTVAIYRKLGVRGRAEATAWAYRNGVLD